MLRAALLALIALVALAVDPVDELTMAIRNGSPREALEKTQVWLRSHSANAKDTMTSPTATTTRGTRKCGGLRSSFVRPTTR